MATHLAHKLPWGSLMDILLLHAPPDPHNTSRPYSIEIGEREKKKIGHFARCFVAAVQEFRASDQSSDDERHLYDPRTWPDQREHGAGGWAGFFDSLVSGYIHLNLILSDADKFLCRLMPYNRANHTFRLMLGHHDGGHPPELANHLQQAFDGDTLKPLDAEVTQVLRDHAAMMFRCMYSISGKNEFVDDEAVAYEIQVVCRVY